MARKKMPKGLEEFEGSLHNLDYAPRLLKRLLDLPEHGFQRDMDSFRDAMHVVGETERAAVAARETARQIAYRVWCNAKKNWTVAELQKATGYDDE